LLARYAAAGIPVHVFPFSSMYGREALRQGLRLRRFLREEGVDIFHAHDRYSDIFGVPWARLAGAKVIASRRWWIGSPRRGYGVAVRWSYRLAHRVLANSEGVAELLESAEGVPANRIAVVRNFVDEDAFETPPVAEREAFLRSVAVGPQATPVIGIVANLRPLKDHATLFRAMGILGRERPDLKLILIGDGESRGALESLARELGIAANVVFAGRRTGPNLHHLFDISVLCSTSEGFSNSILEAMAAGNPVVATDVGATRDAVIDGQTGLLVPPSDPERLASAIAELLHNPERARAMGQAGQQRARDDYCASRSLEALEGLYEELAGVDTRVRNAPVGSLAPAM
jgi:glycosyltransferase involved in cell wall biosynthesis